VSEPKYYFCYCQFEITVWDWTPSKIAFWCDVIILHVGFFHWYFCHSRLISFVHGSFYHVSQSLSSAGLLKCCYYVAFVCCLLCQCFPRRVTFSDALTDQLRHVVCFFTRLITIKVKPLSTIYVQKSIIDTCHNKCSENDVQDFWFTWYIDYIKCVWCLGVRSVRLFISESSRGGFVSRRFSRTAKRSQLESAGPRMLLKSCQWSSQPKTLLLRGIKSKPSS